MTSVTNADTARLLRGAVDDLLGGVDESGADFVEGEVESVLLVFGEIAAGFFFEDAQGVNLELGDVEVDHGLAAAGGDFAHVEHGLGNDGADEGLDAGLGEFACATGGAVSTPCCGIRRRAYGCACAGDCAVDWGGWGGALGGFFGALFFFFFEAALFFLRLFFPIEVNVQGGFFVGHDCGFLWMSVSGDCRGLEVGGQ